MTIALGVLTHDFLIISADTEETDGFLKTNQRKIALASNIHIYTFVGSPKRGKAKSQTGTEHAACAITGAGSAGYLDTITPMLVADFQATVDSDEDAIQDAFSKTVRQFYLDHVVPLGHLPLGERPDFSVLIGVTHKDRRPPLLFASEKTALRRCAPHAAVGVGASFATMLLKRWWPDVWVDRKTAALLTAYLMFHVKESVENCGKFTDILVLHEGTRTFFPQSLGRELETIFLRYGRLEGDAMHALFGMSATHQAQSVSNVGTLFEEFRKEVTALASKWPIANV